MKLVLACMVAVLSGCVWYLHPSCSDQIMNGNETDIDCGGTCTKCEIGQGCNVNAECDESNCINHTCTPYDCDNGKIGQQETDVDCGGPMCRKCAGGRHCVVATDCASGSCDAATSTCFELSTVSFAPAVSYPSGLKSYAIFSGDMNGDGRVDIAVANEEGSSISVFLANLDGTFLTLANEDMAFPTGTYPTGGKLIDLDGDGILDVVTADYHGNSISVLLGLGTGGVGNGRLGPKRSFPTVDGGATSNLDVGDLDGDGQLDVIATNPERHSMSVFLGNGDGTFKPQTEVIIGVNDQSGPFSPAIGDFNGDGHADVAIGDVVGPLIVKLGNGDGTFGLDVPYLTQGIGPYVCLTADLDQDGKLDIACSDRGSDSSTVFLGKGDGTFKKAIIAKMGMGTGPYTIAVGDFNADGVPDLITANFMSSTGAVVLGIGNGQFEAPIDGGVCGMGSYGVAVGDFNGDGKLDFATSNARSSDLTVKLSTSH